ncbi:hypothetical protein CPB83DRAFT_299478 [Crepidotus variabilis]|uniref:MYND-type domain-containing protein n=1 Tax=Crepidotus variabilis TaxID=179855 RepID=A0A9P6EGT7_9AGAR|nr:hypothetical protein CPB83DRAFT_299478 [Crepidotus variabilis]
MVTHRIGEEARIGNLGGGLVSAESHRNLIKAEDLCRRGKPEQCVPYLMKALEDVHNLDAVIQMAFLAPGHRPEGIEILEQGEEVGRKLLKTALGEKAFDDNGGSVGRFWLIIQTRPYMRLLQALVRMYFEEGRYADTARTIEEILRLCPGDNLALKHWLGPMLNQCGRHSDALFFSQAWWHEGIFPARGGTAFTTPNPEVPASMSEDAVQFIPCSLVYTAALSSFKFFGDCDQSRTYLKMSAISNPGVLLKILARVQRPANLNFDGRSMNGAEDAQDYLCQTQNLWMEDDIWNWANQSEAKSLILKICSRAHCEVKEKRVAEFKRCAACHKASYCSQTCQKLDWPTHKPGLSDCLAHKQLKATMRTFMAGKSAKDGSVPVVGTDTSELGTSIFTNVDLQ